MTNKDDLFNRFKYHPPVTAERQKAHEAVRAACLELALGLEVLLPEGREKALVLTKIEEAMFWANASIARQVDKKWDDQPALTGTGTLTVTEWVHGRDYVFNSDGEPVWVGDGYEPKAFVKWATEQ